MAPGDIDAGGGSIITAAVARAHNGLRRRSRVKVHVEPIVEQDGSATQLFRADEGRERAAIAITAAVVAVVAVVQPVFRRQLMLQMLLLLLLLLWKLRRA